MAESIIKKVKIKDASGNFNTYAIDATTLDGAAKDALPYLSAGGGKVSGSTTIIEAVDPDSGITSTQLYISTEGKASLYANEKADLGVNGGAGLYLSKNTATLEALDGCTYKSYAGHQFVYNDDGAYIGITKNGTLEYKYSSTLDPCTFILPQTTGDRTLATTDQLDYYVPSAFYSTGLAISDYSSSGDNKYYVPYATSTQYGVVKLGNSSTLTTPTTSSATAGAAARNYYVGKDTNGKLAVYVPWTDTNYYPIRYYSSGLQISSYSGSSNCSLYVPYATTTQYGVAKVGESTTALEANAYTKAKNSTYPVQKNSSGQLSVNVPNAIEGITTSYLSLSSKSSWGSSPTSSQTYYQWYLRKGTSTMSGYGTKSVSFSAMYGTSVNSDYQCAATGTSSSMNTCDNVQVFLTDGYGMSSQAGQKNQNSVSTITATSMKINSSTKYVVQGFTYYKCNTETGSVYWLAIGSASVTMPEE